MDSPVQPAASRIQSKKPIRRAQMKKGYLAVIAFAVLGALVVAGCGSSDDTTGESAGGGSAESGRSAYGGGAYGGGGESSSTTASEEGASSGTATFVSTGMAGD